MGITFAKAISPLVIGGNHKEVQACLPGLLQTMLYQEARYGFVSLPPYIGAIALVSRLYFRRMCKQKQCYARRGISQIVFVVQIANQNAKLMQNKAFLFSPDDVW